MKMEVWRWKTKPNTLNSLVGGASQGGLCHWLPYSTVLLRAWAFTASSCKVRPNVSWHSSQSLHLLVFSTDYFKQVPWRLGECLHTCKSCNFLQSSPSPIHQCHCLLRGQGAHTGSKCGFLSFPQTVHQQVQRTQYSETNGFSHSRNPRLGVSHCPGYTSPLPQLPWLSPSLQTHSFQGFSVFVNTWSFWNSSQSLLAHYTQTLKFLLCLYLAQSEGFGVACKDLGGFTSPLNDFMTPYQQLFVKVL